MWRLLSASDPLLQPLTHLFVGVDCARGCLAAVLMLLAASAMAVPPFYGYRYPDNFWAAMFTTDDAMTCVVLDLLIVAVAFLAWAFDDARRLGFSLLTYLALVGGLAIAVSLPMPLYLAVRTLRLAKADHESALAEQQGAVRVELQLGSTAAPKTAMSPLCPLALLVVLGLGSQLAFILT